MGREPGSGPSWRERAATESGGDGAGWATCTGERCQRGRVKLSSSGQASSGGEDQVGGAGATGAAAAAGGISGLRREMASRGRRRALLRTGGSSGWFRAGGCWVDWAGGRQPGGRCGSRGSCQGSRQSSSSSRIQSSLSSTHRPSSPRRGRTPGPGPAARLALREPGRAPETPSTSCRPALINRSMPCSSASDPRGMERGVERDRGPSGAGSDQRSAIWQRYRRRALSQRSRVTPTKAMATPLHSRLQRKTATLFCDAR
jgi:hypothetical protein